MTSLWTSLASLLWMSAAAQFCSDNLIFSVRKDLYLEAPVLAYLTSDGYSLCALDCGDVAGSVSYNYFRPNRKCECLGKSSATWPQSLVSRVGWRHGCVATPGKNVTAGSGCLCGGDSLCRLHLQQDVCKKACAAPPPLNDSSVTVTSRAASYTCLEDFTFFGSSSHVTCTAEGTWEGLNGTCQRTSWINPVEIVFPIPQPVPVKWRVDVFFKMTSTTMTQLLLMDGSDLRLLISARVNFSGENYTELNSFYGGVWQSPVRVLQFPWRTGMDYNVSTVMDCPDVGFQVLVNGTMHGVYYSSKPCTPLTAVKVVFGAELYTVRMVYP